MEAAVAADDEGGGGAGENCRQIAMDVGDGGGCGGWW